MKTIILSHDTALAYWSHPAAHQLPFLGEASAAEALGSSRGAIHAHDIDRLLFHRHFRGFPKPLDILVPSKGEHRTTCRGRFHYCAGFPPESVCPMHDGVLHIGGELHRILVCSPELVVSQMASLVDEIELLEIAYELCGCYSLHPDPEGYLTKRPPVTTPDRIRRFLDGAAGLAGSRAAGSIAPWIIGMSRSPKETQLAIASVLPRSRGGYGLPAPLLNEEIPTPANVGTVLGARNIIPDLLWGDQGIAIEYDSDLVHTEETAAHDARKRTAYRMMGLDLLSLTLDQVRDRATFENIMIGLERQLRPRHKPPTSSQLERRAALHAKLFVRKRRERVFITRERVFIAN